MKNTIFNFEHFLVYLAGPVQYVDDRGIGWRKNVTHQMVKIGIPENQILDPCNKPLNNFYKDDIDAHVKHLQDMRDAGDWVAIEKIVCHTIRVDLRLVDKSDLIYMHVDPNIHSCGTYDEMSIARNEKKPVIAVVNGGIAKAPLWLIGRIGAKHIFGSDDDAIQYLSDVMHGKISFDPKSWLFFDMGDK